MATAPPLPVEDRFFRRFLALSIDYWNSEEKWKVRLLTTALAVLTVGQVVTPVLINFWSKRLFDALEQRSMQQFLTMVGLMLAIILFNVVNTVLHLRTKRALQLGWRQWLVRKVLDGWLSRGRHHQVTYMPGEHDNPDGRIAEDIRITTESAIDLALSLAYCLLLFASFVNILWTLSGTPQVILFGTAVTIHGYLLWVAVGYAAGCTTIATLLGRPLVRAADVRKGREADFRFGLARVRENAQAIALLHGESDERRRLLDLVGGIKLGWDGQTRALSNVMTFSAAYSVLSVAVPVLVAAPRYITGSITLGGLMQTAQAFQQTAAALSWPIDNLSPAAEWKASVQRVLGLHDALKVLEAEVAGQGGERIVVERSESEPTLAFERVAIFESDGRLAIEPFDAEIMPGERVLVTGDPGAAIKLFKAVARVWPWGSGRIVLPTHTRVFLMPQRPYLPRGPLRNTLSYPAGPETVDGRTARDALQQVGLAHLIPFLDTVEAWDGVLAVAEQQRLGFARLLVRRPDWIFMENATDALDPEGEEDLLRLLDEDFPTATLLTIGSHASLEAHHARKLVLERINGTVRLLHQGACRPAVRVLAGGRG